MKLWGENPGRRSDFIYLFIFLFFVTLVIYYMFDAENLCIGYMNWASSYFLKVTSL